MEWIDMLKKGQPIKFVKPGTNMELVYKAIQSGLTDVVRISVMTKLTQRQVIAARGNLRFVGLLELDSAKGVDKGYFIKPEPPSSSLELQKLFGAIIREK